MNLMPLFQQEAVSIFGVVAGSWILIRKKQLVFPDKVVPSKREFVRKNKNKIENIFRVMIALVVGILLFGNLFGFVLDIPNMLSKNYKTTEVVIKYGDGTKRMKEKIREYTVYDKNSKKTYWVNIYTVKLKSGTNLKISYLPNTKYANIVDAN
jgi:hypothetical protein